MILCNGVFIVTIFPVILFSFRKESSLQCSLQKIHSNCEFIYSHFVSFVIVTVSLDSLEIFITKSETSKANLLAILAFKSKISMGFFRLFH